MKRGDVEVRYDIIDDDRNRIRRFRPTVVDLRTLDGLSLPGRKGPPRRAFVIGCFHSVDPASPRSS
jgi:hypothetical protein